ncbi:NAD-dependent epimerase/dehydratase family protein [Nesterenkonia sp. E16_7]|uniref:NAD-dependent epimerase/dehydratase family protein n=1 Tax=unclassified Nesterenkonia TaxID=2629769 RepID=UPI001A932A9F|nr:MULTISPECIES: NAD-dependent epimerase/dehydratase family protein [unclassified Nesterenkonia]MBO0596722.1 NAD-dependent epimerase/dehydratase family protein [Nesterenkonia sp. E16_10]MBO0597884.1 NAD-dependent epimerase/dehydratase family protein [Nesterenkonia sp. E16_7]
MGQILILGGTGWLGREIATAALEEGHEVTALARGSSGVTPEGVRLIRADRTEPGAYDQVQHAWDEVIELSCAPPLVESALEVLAGHARHWTLISSVSVYARNDQPDADETAQLVEPRDLQDYADAKVHAERISRARLGERLLIIRPGLISGPRDPSDRFGYWPARFQRGGPILVPEAAGRWVQTIDVSDLAGFILLASSTRTGGELNAVGHSISLEEFFTELGSAAPAGTTLVSATDEWLRENDVRHWAGPRSLPLWLPRADVAFARRSNAAFLRAGGTLRPWSHTTVRVLEDERLRGLLRPRRSGLSLDEEAELLRLHRSEPVFGTPGDPIQSQDLSSKQR